ncbi:hypothetical protein SKAU_G00009080 [Synaphobranchus kaupii]|uniref:Uncharacterized protein n=1 Tax=Synaphobranchus kaupii TaxID=118154 RepID=A0A9Q1JCS2_SYNKA|nr:hypothetical protein SKAU_G00009080 [Synaphobranchus kaupii]
MLHVPPPVARIDHHAGEPAVIRARRVTPLPAPISAPCLSAVAVNVAVSAVAVSNSQAQAWFSQVKRILDSVVEYIACVFGCKSGPY